MTRELRLKTQRPGTLVIGPVRVRQGLAGKRDPALYRDGGQRRDRARDGRIADRPPADQRRSPASAQRPGRAQSDPPGDSVLVGQQLDVIAAAWFPRELRAR